MAEWGVAIAAFATLILQTWLFHRSIGRVFSQADFFVRAAQANADKLTSKVMALADARVYQEYRSGAGLGVPEGSVPAAEPGALRVDSNDRSEMAHMFKMLQMQRDREREMPGGNGTYPEGPGEPG